MIDYDVGDVVVCIKSFKDGPTTPPHIEPPSRVPEVGSYYRVIDIRAPHINWGTSSGAPWVRLKDFEESYGWDGAHFKKLPKGKDIFKLVTKKDVPKEMEPA